MASDGGMASQIPSHDDLSNRCLCIDVGTARHDRLDLRDVGAFRPDLGARLTLKKNTRDFAARLDRLTEGARFVLGHNYAQFDRPVLAHLHPTLTLHDLPLVDTLELSPVAFPQNPYHRLVKDYKLCTTTRSNSVRDAELAYELFGEQCSALLALIEQHPEEALCLHFLLAPQDAADTGLGALWSAWRGEPRPSLTAAKLAWLRATRGKVCSTAQRDVVNRWLPDPKWHSPLAYVLSWLRVAGGNSVLPAWVGNRFPQTLELIRALRDTPCDEAQCTWCMEQHQLDVILPRYFPGITEFRASPATSEGKSLQRAIVENGLAGRSTLAILPTGGGKSLCYQLPALAHYYRSGGVTVVISPLQSLMKDQVDNLQARGITCAGYLNSLLTPMERRAMLDKLRLGDLGLVFVAPEQFRSTAFSNSLQHREVRAWVFDEAHCLSKWGHDFRPDYLYVSRFIKRRQQADVSPVFCFTATAQPGVIDDICVHFEKHLGLSLERLTGGVERNNLQYEVHAVPTQAKYGETLRLLQEAMKQDDGGAIVFCARQKTVEEVAAFLRNAGLECGYFHGGMPGSEKRQIQDDFIAGRLRVIAATNAFGMGVDKPDVRLVIHIDTPGSLENYLQEAGRAGRDQAPARCVLLYDEADLDVQFRLLRNARLNQQDIQSILKALRAIRRKDGSDGEVIASTGEILLEIPETHRIDPEARDADTKVRIAIAWLEEARLLVRHENHTRVFPSSLLITSLDEARARLLQKLGSAADITPYLSMLTVLMQTDEDESLSTDDLMIATGKDKSEVQAMLRELNRWQLLSDDSEIGVTFHREPDTRTRLETLIRLEDALLVQLREAAPDADSGEWQILNVRQLCDRLRRETGLDLDPDRLARLLKSFSEAFGEDHGLRGLLEMRPGGMDHRYIRMLHGWKEVDSIRQRRMQVARALVKAFSALRKGQALLVTCKQGELESALQSDLTLSEIGIGDWDRPLSSALLYLDANEVLHLARGKAVFRSAMRIEFSSEAQRRRFSKGDYAELALHYKSKIVQVHVMAEFAKLAVHKIQAAMQFILDYFRLGRDEFIRRHFAGRKDVLEMATTEAAHRRILVDLANPEQQAIVAAPLEGNQLVLAGPGSGKTRVLVHRIAWLLRECLVEPGAIMVLTFGRSAAHEVRSRLWNLVGMDAAGVVVQTLHGLAMRLTGTSYAVAAERNETIDFSQVIRLATRHLQQDADGHEPGASLARDRLLAGLRFVLVDEYQDINADHYALISVLAGRTLRSEEDRLSLMVVGDDDQNILAFSGADVRHIRQFETEYQARRYNLLENYRSTRHIIDCASCVIAPAHARMKHGQVLRVNHARNDHPAGGNWTHKDELTRGRVHVLEAPPQPLQEAAIALAELERLYALDDATNRAGRWGRFAVIARRWDDLAPFAALCRQRGIPAQYANDQLPIPLHSSREGFSLLCLLRGEIRQARRKRVTLRAATLRRWYRQRHRVSLDGWIDNPFLAALAQFILEVETASSGFDRTVDSLVDALHEFDRGIRRTGAARPHAPLTLITAHSAKGLEFDHVLILDAAGWRDRSDDERRLFYVAMTRARQTLTLCEVIGNKHPFTPDIRALALHTRPTTPALPEVEVRHVQAITLENVYLSWPARFNPDAAIHKAIAALQIGDSLSLRRRVDGQPGWELTDAEGMIVARMASRFSPLNGKIAGVRVAAIQVRQARADDDLRSPRWELVVPEIEYIRDSIHRT